jgi:tetratricopeptide (TPR) repeat protein
MNRRRLILMAASALLCAALLVPGCSATRASGPYAPVDEALRDPRKAERLNYEAAPLIHSDPAQAEKLLRQALTADLYCGPAHNNLGAVYLAQGRLYEAAGEFEWARKLLPGHPDPRLNLALVLEKAGRMDEALDTYATALEVYPGHIPTIQAIARLQVRSGRTDERTTEFLDEIALRGETDEWRSWAQLQRLKLTP